MSPEDFLQKISAIVGQDISSGQITMRVSWNDPAEARSLLLRLRTMQKQLRLLKRDASAMISSVKSEYATARMRVGKTFASGLAAGFFGRRTVGHFNSAQRDSLRRSQVSAVAPFERVKGIIDSLLYQLDTVKGQIELSPEYLSSASRAKPVIKAEVVASTPFSKPPPLPLSRFYIYIGDQVKGPYSREQLQALRDASAIADDTLCCAEGSEVWITYTEVSA